MARDSRKLHYIHCGVGTYLFLCDFYSFLGSGGVVGFGRAALDILRDVDLALAGGRFWLDLRA